MNLSFSQSLFCCFFFFFLLYREDSSFLIRHVIVPLLQERLGEVSFGSHQNNMKGDYKNRWKVIWNIPFSRDKTSATMSSILLTHQNNMKTAAIMLFYYAIMLFWIYVNGQNDPPSLRFQGVIDNLNTLSSFIICHPTFSPAFLLQLQSCYEPLMALISSFPPTHQTLPQTWKVPLFCFRACTSATATAPLSQPSPLLNVEKSKLSQKPAGQTVSDHVRTAISQAMLTYVDQTKKMGCWPKHRFQH